METASNPNGPAVRLCFFEFLEQFRRELLECIDKFEDSSSMFGWDTTIPNRCIASQLDYTLQKHLELAKTFDIYCVERHSECGKSYHYRRASDGQVIIGPDGDFIRFQDQRFFWASALSYCDRIEICPCTKNAEPTSHFIVEDIIIRDCGKNDPRTYAAKAFSELARAIDNAREKKSRSGVREYLLKAVLSINDAILPIPVQDYIQNQLSMLAKR